MSIEAEILSELNHKNIVKIQHIIRFYDTFNGRFPIRLCHFMELCTRNLSYLLRKYSIKGMTMSEGYALHWFHQIASAVEYIHSKRIAHMDIKPGNILCAVQCYRFTIPSVYKLTDFGVSLKFGPKLMTTKGMFGTPGYTPPEIDGSKRRYAVKPVDIYSLGICLAESLRFSGSEKCDQISGQKLSADVIELIKRMTSNKPSERPAINEVLSSEWIRKPNIE